MLHNISLDHTQVSHDVQGEGTNFEVTVPSGKVWDVVMSTDDAAFQFSGTFHVICERYPQRLILDEGMSIEYNSYSSGSNGGVIRGFEYDKSNLENDPVAVRLQRDESVTVPSGEVWHVHTNTDGGGFTHVNNSDTAIHNRLGVNTGHVRHPQRIPFFGGDVLMCNFADNIYINGWEVS